MRRRVDRGDRAGQHLGQAARRTDKRTLSLQLQQFVLADDFIEHRQLDGDVGDRRITEARQADLGHVQHLLAGGFVVFAQALQVILDAGQGVGQAIELRPGRRRFIHQQVRLNVFVAGGQQAGGPRQRNHRQRATHLHQQRRQRLQPLPIPGAVDVLDDHVLGLLQACARFADHQLVDLRQVGGRQMAVFGSGLLHSTNHAGQGRFDVEQGAGNVHQGRVVDFALALSQALNDRQLIDDHLARLTKAQHCQGIGDLPQRRQQAAELTDLLAVAAHEAVEPLFDSHQFLAQGADHRAHRVAVRTGQACALFVDQHRVGQGFGETVLVLEQQHVRRVTVGLGDVKQQALEQLIGRWLINAGDALLQQALEFFVRLLEQTAQRRAAGELAVGHGLDQRRGDLPQRAERCVFAQLLKAGEDFGHVAEVVLHVLLAQQPEQRGLQHMPQFAQHRTEVRAVKFAQGVGVERRDRQ